MLMAGTSFSLVHTAPEEFEHGVSILKMHQGFSLHTTRERNVKTGRFGFVLRKTRAGYRIYSINTAAFIKYFVIRARCLFEGDVYLKSSLFLLMVTEHLNFNKHKHGLFLVRKVHSISMSLSASRK